MNSDEHGGLPEDVFERLLVIDQHIARAGAHEYFESAHPRRIRAQHFIKVIVGHTHVKGVVGQRVPGRNLVLFFQQRLVEGRRLYVGHFHERGDAPRHSCPCFAADIAFVGQARLAEVYLIVNDAGHGQQAVSPHFLATRRGLYDAANAAKQAVLDEEVAFDNLPLVDDAGILDDSCCHSLLTLSR